MMNSAVYQLAADHNDAAHAIDPDNELLWRWNRRRVEAEPIRDAMLAVSGLLDETMYGPGTLDDSHTRRSIYFFVKRSQLTSMLTIFDRPEPLVSIASRPTTTIAPQALWMMNNPQERDWALAFIAEQSSAYAASRSRDDSWTDLCQVLMSMNEFVYID